MTAAHPGLAALQIEAYTAVCRAFYAQEALKWDQEDVLTTLRQFWNIDNTTHGTITNEMKTDPDVVAVRKGGMPSRVGRGRPAAGGLAPAPSLGGAAAAVSPRAQQLPPPLFDGRRQPLPAYSELSSPAGSLYSEGGSQQSRPSRARGGGAAGGGRSKKKHVAGGGGGGGAKSRAASMGQQQSLRRAPSSRPVGPAAAVAAAAPGAAPGLQRSRSTRAANAAFGGAAADPLGYVGRRLWRFWAEESPPWVEGFIQQWDPVSDGYTVVYDPNTRESTEEVFHFGAAVEGSDYVLGEYVDMASAHGSRRQHERPYIPPEVLQQPPPPGLLAAMAPVPSKKRKSTSGAPVPADAPFEMTYLHARLPVAQEDELQQMLTVLERKERIVEAEINILEYQEANREDIEKRAALERRFQELCEKEALIMTEMAALREAGAA